MHTTGNVSKGMGSVIVNRLYTCILLSKGMVSWHCGQVLLVFFGPKVHFSIAIVGDFSFSTG